MPKLGPPVVSPQKQPVVVRDQVTSKMPNAVVFILAIAQSLIQQTRVCSLDRSLRRRRRVPTRATRRRRSVPNDR